MKIENSFLAAMFQLCLFGSMWISDSTPNHHTFVSPNEGKIVIYVINIHCSLRSGTLFLSLALDLTQPNQAKKKEANSESLLLSLSRPVNSHRGALFISGFVSIRFWIWFFVCLFRKCKLGTVAIDFSLKWERNVYTV